MNRSRFLIFLKVLIILTSTLPKTHCTSPKKNHGSSTLVQQELDVLNY